MSTPQGATFYPNIDDDKTRFLRNGLHGEFESVWGTIQGPYEIAFVLKEKSCQNRRLANWIRDQRDNKPKESLASVVFFSILFALLLGSATETWIFVLVCDAFAIGCARHIEFFFPIYFEPLIADTKVVSIYKNMDLEELRKLLRSLYWQYKTTSNWPTWVKSKDGTMAYPFSALVMNPETFERAGNDDHEKIFQLTPCEVAPLNHANVTLKIPRKYWNSKHEEFSQWMSSMATWLMHHWLRSLIVVVVLAETFSLNFAVVGIQGWTAQWVLRQADRMFVVAHIIITDPLRRIFRKGPVVSTSFGDFGFWENKPLPVICEQMMSRFDKDFWAANPEKCRQEYQDREDGFVMVTLLVFGLMFAYWSFKVSTARQLMIK